MNRRKSIFQDSFQELKNLKTLAAVSMLLAITVVLGFYRLQITDYIRIGFDSLAKELTAMLFGPSVACLTAAIADIVSYILKPVGAFFPGLTISAMLAGCIYGVLLYRKPLSFKRVLAANALVAVFVNLLLNTYWFSILYGNAFLAMLPARAVKQIIMLPIDAILFYAVAKALEEANILGRLRSLS